MLGIDQRALQAAWTVFLLALGIALLYWMRGTLVTFTLALFLAILLSPVVTWVDRVTPFHFPRTAALATVYVVLIGVAVAILIPLGSALSQDAASLAQRLPGALENNPLQRIPLPAALEPVRDNITALIQERLTQLGRDLLPLLGRAAGQVATGLGALLSLVLIPILAFFFIKDARPLRHGIVRCFAPHRQVGALEVLTDLQNVLTEYVRALVILSAATFTAYSIFLAITGSPYAVLLAGAAAVLEFVPAVGPLVAVIAILIVAVITGYQHWLVMLVFFGCYRIFQDYMLNPALMSANVRIHPLLVIFGVLAGGELGGIEGIFFSIPVIAAVRVIYLRLSKDPEIAGLPFIGSREKV